MSYSGYADLDRPFVFSAGNIYHPFGGGSFFLTPYRCSVADLDDGRTNFSLDIVRAISPLVGNDASYATLEMRLNADYATDDALTSLRQKHPGARLSRCALTNWSFRLAPGPATRELPPDLLEPTALASNNLGAARLAMRLPIDSALILEALLGDTTTPVYAIAAAEMQGVSPRVEAVVRFKTAHVLPFLLNAASPDRVISWHALVTLLSQHVAQLPITITGQLPPERLRAFGEALADRIIDRFGTYVMADDTTSEPLVRLIRPDEASESNLIWSLSQPFLASRRIVLHFDLLSDMRQVIQQTGIDTFVHRHTATSFPSFGQSHVMVFCTLPAERLGAAALGATLMFPPAPPDRPHGKRLTVLLEPPDDLVQEQVQLAPGEPLRYTYQTFVVIADEHGAREVQGNIVSYEGTPLRLSPEDFPLEFVLIEMAEGLGLLASVTGVCHYEHAGNQYTLPFTLDSGRLSVSLMLPQGSQSVRVEGTAHARYSDATLPLGPFESPHIRLDVFSFAEYGWHEVEITCEWAGAASMYAIDVIPAGLAETFENITTLAFTPDQPRRTFGWLARSPFMPGFRYRSHRDGITQGGWQDVPEPVAHLVIQPEQPITERASEVIAQSEMLVYSLLQEVAQPTSETTEAGIERESVSVPISPQPEPTDELLYSMPEDTRKKLYIPRYEIDTQIVSGRQRYRVVMEQQDTTSSLTVHLIKGPAEALREKARKAEEYPHEITIQLTFLQAPPAGARKTLVFDEITFSGEFVMARLTFATLGERDEVFQALTESEYDTQLIVSRIIDVAVPHRTHTRGQPSSKDIPTLMHSKVTLPPRPFNSRLKPNVLLKSNMLTMASVGANHHLTVHESGMVESQRAMTIKKLPAVVSERKFIRKDLPIPVRDKVFVNRYRSSLPTPQLAFTGKAAETIRGNKFLRAKLSVTNWEEFSSDFFKPSPDLPPCGRNKNAARTWVHIHNAANDVRLYGYCAISSPSNLQHLSFAVRSSQKLPERVYVCFEDRRTKTVRKSNVVETGTPEPEGPLYRETRKDVTQAVQPTPFVFSQSLHSYIFAGIIPDSEAGGLVSFRFEWNGRFYTYLQDVARPSLVYFFPDQFKIARRREAPFTPFITVRVVSNSGMDDTNIIFDYIVAPFVEPRRLEQARQALLTDPHFTPTEVQFQPFITSDVRFFIDRPTEHGTIREERTGASLVLQDSLKDTLVMTLPDFRILFDAMHRDTASLFLGRVEIAVPGESVESVPFTARLNDLTGELFLYSATPNDDGTIAVTLMNAIESPLRINALEATIVRGEQFVNASIQDVALPVERLEAGDIVAMTVVPETLPPGASAVEVKFVVDHVDVISDPEAIWDTILDRTTVEYFDKITVKSVSGLFAPIPERTNDQIVAILVEFEGGGTAELSASQLEDTVRIDYSIDDVVLGRAIDTTYRYIVTVVRSDGKQERDAEPRQGSAKTFFVNVQR